MARAAHLLEWADATGAFSFEALAGQKDAFDAVALALRGSAAIDACGERLRERLRNSPILEAAAGSRTQDPLSLRAMPHLHGAARDTFADAERVLDRELRAVTDNPVVTGTPEEPRVHSEAHAVGAALALALDGLAVAVAAVAAMSERRIDRLVNPLVSRLPAFLSPMAGVGSGFMIAQDTAAGLVADNRRLASPASLDGGITSALQEDHLCHPTGAALKLLGILDNAEAILAIELLAAAQAHDLRPQTPARGPGTEALHRQVRAVVPVYRDDRPLADDVAHIRTAMTRTAPDEGR